MWTAKATTNTPPPMPTPGETVGARDASVTQVSGNYFILCFTNDFLQSGVNCDGPTTNTHHSNTNALTKGGSRCRHVVCPRSVLFFSFFFVTLLTIFYNQAWTAMGWRQTHITVIPTPWRTEASRCRRVVSSRSVLFFFPFFCYFTNDFFTIR